MKRLLVLTLLAGGGCGAIVDMPGAASTSQATRNKPVTWNMAGTYVGLDTCTTTGAWRNNVIGVGTEEFLLRTTLSSAGVPMAEEISRAGVAAGTTIDGQFTTTCTTTDVSFGEHSVVIRELCEQLVDGVDSCEFALNGTCDEPLACAWSTDFSDCGPIQWDLEKTSTFLFPYDGTIFRTVSQVLVESTIGDDSMSVNCTGELTREPLVP